MSQYDAIIIGGGPSGSSAAISLSLRGARVLVLEEKRMPRGKLCGEFITPECFPTLHRLGVMEQMANAGAQKITRVNLIVPSGRSVETSVSGMSQDANWAMSLSRARFDQILFDRARESGATCLEGVAVRACDFDNGGIGTVHALSLKEGSEVSFTAPLIIDGSGRNSRLMIGRQERQGGRRGSRLYALKAHFKDVNGIKDQVELYFFPEGYGGLTLVESGLVNLCFIVSERALKDAGGEPAMVLQATLMKNTIAGERLRGAQLEGKWHSAGPLSFGRRRLSRDGVIAIGDASGMIDPFTGTGIQIALRTGEMAAEAVWAAMSSSRDLNGSRKQELGQRVATLRDAVLASYSHQYREEFHKRMRVAGLLRVAAFSTVTASGVASVLARVPMLASLVLRATRSGKADGV